MSLSLSPPRALGVASAAIFGLLVFADIAATAERPVTYRPHNINDPEILALLKPGQIVVSEQGSAMSFLFTMSADEYQPFVHAGIVAIEHGRPYVYESRGKAWVIRENPLEAVKGRINRMSLATYAEAQKYMEIHDLPEGIDGELVAKYARRQHELGTPFDPFFDDRDREALYCTEFIAAALEAGGARDLPKARYRSNPSFRKVFDWLDIHAQSMYLAGSFISPDSHVVSFSNGVTARTIRVHFALNRELHRRFTSDQKLGNVFVWKNGNLRLRPELRAFRRAGEELFEDRVKDPPTQAEADTAIQELALRMFGPITDSSSVARADLQPGR